METPLHIALDYDCKPEVIRFIFEKDSKAAKRKDCKGVAPFDAALPLAIQPMYNGILMPQFGDQILPDNSPQFNPDVTEFVDALKEETRNMPVDLVREIIQKNPDCLFHAKVKEREKAGMLLSNLPPSPRPARKTFAAGMLDMPDMDDGGGLINMLHELNLKPTVQGAGATAADDDSSDDGGYEAPPAIAPISGAVEKHTRDVPHFIAPSCFDGVTMEANDSANGGTKVSGTTATHRDSAVANPFHPQHNRQVATPFQPNPFGGTVSVGGDSGSGNGAKVTWVALYDYSAHDDDEVSFNEGDTVLNVAPLPDEGWSSGTVERTGRSGSFPEAYVEECKVSSDSAEIPVARGVGDGSGSASEDEIIFAFPDASPGTDDDLSAADAVANETLSRFKQMIRM